MAIVALAALFALPACKQKEGETCQTSSDCSKGLVCCFDGHNASDTLGVCTAGDRCTPLPDGGVDGGTEPDAAQPDAAQPDAAQPDAAQPDAAQPDAAQPDAALDLDAQMSLDASITQDASP